MRTCDLARLLVVTRELSSCNMAAHAERALSAVHSTLIDSKLDFAIKLVESASGALGISPPHASGVVLALVVVVATVLVSLGAFFSGSKIALHKDIYHPFELAEIEEISHDTKRLRFNLQSPSHKLGKYPRINFFSHKFLRVA